MPGTTTNLNLRYPVASDAPDGAGAITNLAQDIEDRFGRTASAPGNLAAGTRYGQRAVVGTTEYRWNGSAWIAWDSEWISWASSWANVGTSSKGGQYRFVGGRVRVEQAAQLQGAASNTIFASLPFNARQTPLYTGVNSQSGWWASGRGNLYNGNDLDLVLAFDSAGYIRFGLTNSSKTIDKLGTSAATTADGNAIRFVLDFDPA